MDDDVSAEFNGALEVGAEKGCCPHKHGGCVVASLAIVEISVTRSVGLVGVSM